MLFEKTKKIDRVSLNQAMQQFLEKGGTVKRIKSPAARSSMVADQLLEGIGPVGLPQRDLERIEKVYTRS